MRKSVFSRILAALIAVNSLGVSCVAFGQKSTLNVTDLWASFQVKQSTLQKIQSEIQEGHSLLQVHKKIGETIAIANQKIGESKQKLATTNPTKKGDRESSLSEIAQLEQVKAVAIQTQDDLVRKSSLRVQTIDQVYHEVALREAKVPHLITELNQVKGGLVALDPRFSKTTATYGQILKVRHQINNLAMAEQELERIGSSDAKTLGTLSTLANVMALVAPFGIVMTSKSLGANGFRGAAALAGVFATGFFFRFLGIKLGQEAEQAESNIKKIQELSEFVRNEKGMLGAELQILSDLFDAQIELQTTLN